MICVPITSSGTRALADFKIAQERADIIELRLDLIGISEISGFIEVKKKPVIVTSRSREEGGAYKGDEEVRIKTLVSASRLADYVDIEYSAGKDAIAALQNGKAKIIVSYHNFKSCPDNLKDIYEKLGSAGADIVKIAVTANDIQDNLQIFRLLEEASRPTIAFCMGERGQISRILASRYGSFLTFASLNNESASAPGQLSIDEMKTRFRVDKISLSTKIFGVIGSPAKHSSSPTLFNASYAAAGVDAVHLKFPVDDVSAFVSDFRDIVDGFAVTIPHKETIMEHLDEIDDTAREIGAVNTIVRIDSRLKGYNTDVLGGIAALKRKTGIAGKKVIILGAGGAAKAMAYGITKEGGELTLLNRTPAKAEALSKRFGCAFGPIAQLQDLSYDILINCTAIGMHGERFLDSALLHGVVMDAVYTSTGDTALLDDAKAKGCITVSGHEMLILQALDQFRMWTGKEASEGVMTEALHGN